MAMKKPAILFIHGFPFDREMWRPQFEGLSDWHCVAPNLRGAGTAVAPLSPDAYSMHTYAQDLIGVLDEQRIERVVVCGLSMGGYITFELLRQVPNRLRALVLCNTKSAADTADGKRGRDTLAEKAQARGASAVADELVPKVLSPTNLERRGDLVREVRAMIERQQVAGIVGALRALRDRPDSTPLLKEIRVPVLAIAGSDDQITPQAGMQEMARAIPNAEFAIIGAAGHLTPVEQPLAFNAAIETFLKKLS